MVFSFGVGSESTVTWPHTASGIPVFGYTAADSAYTDEMDRSSAAAGFVFVPLKIESGSDWHCRENKIKLDLLTATVNVDQFAYQSQCATPQEHHHNEPIHFFHFCFFVYTKLNKATSFNIEFVGELIMYSSIWSAYLYDFRFLFEPLDCGWVCGFFISSYFNSYLC